MSTVNPCYILGLETSADDTAAAIVEVHSRRILGQAIRTQMAEHAAYGGSVTELASRAHQAHLPALVQETFTQAELTIADIHAIATTTGPGLTTALAMGATFGKTLALARGLPFLATNHIEGHALSPLLAEGSALPKAFLQRHEPYVLLLITGGHTQLIAVRDVGHYELLGTTADDAVGECFDKIGAALNLPHPSGPNLAKLAAQGNPHGVILPSPKGAGVFDFSFSGLKTAARQAVEKGSTSPASISPAAISPADIAASLEHTIATLLADKLGKTLAHTGIKHAVAAGGVAANSTIRAALQQACTIKGCSFTAPPLALCTDNAAMIAYAGGLRWQNGLTKGEGLAAPLYPRWPLSDMNSSH
ncbi:MAG: tRNA (adenosine(37)-N6)-threonylcarbamoyltransferase complex transferase subunit TsaD [Pseudomonadota bacterium]